MNFYQIKTKKNDVYPAILADSFMSIYKRKILRRIIFYVMVVSFTFIILDLIPLEFIRQSAFFVEVSNLDFIFRSIFTLFFSLWIISYLLELMYLSYYFKETEVDFEVLKIAESTNDSDVTKAFIESQMGSYAMARLGFSKKDIKEFLKSRTDFVTSSEYEIIENDDKHVSFSEYGYSLIHFDSDFNKLLKSAGVTAKDFKDCLNWLSRINKRIRENERWWTKEKLYRIPSIGRNWSFGQVYLLNRFGHSIYNDASYIYLADKWRLYKEYLLNIENVLLKQQGANVMLTSKESFISMDVVSSFARMIADGTIRQDLENRRVFVLDGSTLVSAYNNKTEIEATIQKIFLQTAKAGNVILVIPDLDDFVESLHALDIDIKDILSEVLSSERVHVIVTSSSRGFHQTLETDFDLMKNFEKIQIKDLDESSAIELVEDEAQIIESRENIFFTYQALKSVVESADRYFAESSLADKAVDILNEVSTFALSKKKFVITNEDVSSVVESKTGVPVGSLSKKEKDKLQKVEMLLKQKIVGQDKAIEVIATAMKRARLGVANPKRPLGSFLFLGPTGVGKTETSKALTEVFFGDSEEMLRIDMSEFNGPGSVSKLIGDQNNPSGILATKIRENQYGVLLLDEFEKAHEDIHNLFLQILDEGFFSDGMGEKVNARNLIIIATSNAGSNLIYEAQKQNINLVSEKNKIVDHLISSGEFRPELLNRFDDIVIFNPLSDNNLQVIVSLMINRLNKRIEDKGLDIKITDDLVNYLVEVGKDEKFGAREINRVIQNEIELKIADALISEEIKKGDTITFVRKENGQGIDLKVLI